MEIRHTKELTPENYKVIDSKKHVGVLFYAPWCGHCSHFHPTWNKLARMAKFMDFYSYDADKYPVPSNISVPGYPTIAFIKNGEVQYYSGDRDYNSLLKFSQDFAME